MKNKLFEMEMKKTFSIFYCCFLFKNYVYIFFVILVKNSRKNTMCIKCHLHMNIYIIMTVDKLKWLITLDKATEIMRSLKLV